MRDTENRVLDINMTETSSIIKKDFRQAVRVELAVSLVVRWRGWWGGVDKRLTDRGSVATKSADKFNPLPQLPGVNICLSLMMEAAILIARLFKWVNNNAVLQCSLGLLVCKISFRCVRMLFG